MPWPRNDRDPLEAMRRKLAEEEQRLAEEMARLSQELNQAGEPTPAEVKPIEPPIWRMEEDGLSPHRIAEPTPARKRNLARQRQRDMVVFFACIALLLIVIAVLLWVVWIHTATPGHSV